MPTIEPYGDIREYAVKLFANNGQGIGQKGKDNGLLMLLALKERRVWVEVGYDLEQWVTDGFAGETSREVMAPFFRNGQLRSRVCAPAPSASSAASPRAAASRSKACDRRRQIARPTSLLDPLVAPHRHLHHHLDREPTRRWRPA